MDMPVICKQQQVHEMCAYVWYIHDATMHLKVYWSNTNAFHTNSKQYERFSEQGPLFMWKVLIDDEKQQQRNQIRRIFYELLMNEHRGQIPINSINEFE